MSLILLNDGQSRTFGIVVCALGALLVVSSGCRSQPPAGSTAANPANGPWQVAGQTNPSGLNELLNRQQEQARLAAEQRQALAEMAAWQKQQQQLQLMAEDQKSDHLEKLRAEAEIVANQKKELERMAELRRRSLELDSNNRDLHARLAQTQQNNRLLEDQVKLLRQQLDDSAQQIAATMKAQQAAEQRMLQVQRESQQRVAQIAGGGGTARRRAPSQPAAPRQRDDNRQQQSPPQPHGHQHLGIIGAARRGRGKDRDTHRPAV